MSPYTWSWSLHWASWRFSASHSGQNWLNWNICWSRLTTRLPCSQTVVGHQCASWRRGERSTTAHGTCWLLDVSQILIAWCIWILDRGVVKIIWLCTYGLQTWSHTLLPILAWHPLPPVNVYGVNVYGVQTPNFKILYRDFNYKDRWALIKSCILLPIALRQRIFFLVTHLMTIFLEITKS